MILLATQEQYINSLKKIKEVEESVQKEIENHRKKIDDEIKKLQTDVDEAIGKSKIEGEKLVESSIEQARKKAMEEREANIAIAKVKAKNISTEVNTQTAQEIINILLKGIE